MRNLLYKDACPTSSVGLLLLRVVVGAAFIFHGWPKIQKPFNWMPEQAGMPGILQFLAALSEFGGGIALILGVLTPLASLGLAITMAVAAGMVHIPAGHAFVPPPGTKDPSWELPAVYFACAVAILLIGPGRFSLDALLFGKRPASLIT